MSDPINESMPEPGGEYHPGFAELLGYLQRSGPESLFEFTPESDGSTPIILGKSPMPEGTVWMGSDGLPVTSFACKFEDGFDGWQPGDIVNAECMLGERNGQLGLCVTESAAGDIRAADFFALPNLTAEQAATLRRLGVAQVNVDLHIASPPATHTISSDTYEASIHHVHDVQRPWDGEAPLNTDEQVLIQGQVIAYDPGEVPYGSSHFPEVTIRMSDGKEVAVSMVSGYIDYASGALDVLSPTHLQVGDTIQINATYSDAPTAHYGHDRAPFLYAEFCRTAHLQEPSIERKTHYEADRADIAARIDALRQLDDQAFRDAYGELLAAYIKPEIVDGRIATAAMLLAPSELQQLHNLVQQKFPDTPDGPSPDRPIGGIYRKYDAVRTSHIYGVNVFAMSRAQYYDFCLEVAGGRLPEPGPDAYEYPFWLLRPRDGDFTPDELAVVFQRAVDHYTKALVDGHLLTPDGLIPKGHKLYSVAENIFETSSDALERLRRQQIRETGNVQQLPAAAPDVTPTRTPDEMDRIIRWIINETLDGDE